VKRLIHKETLLFLVIFLCAAALYLFNINFSDLWADETYTKALISHPFGQVFKDLAKDFNPPLYYVALKVFTNIVGSNAFTIRLFSVIGALSTLLIGYVVGQRVFGKNCALCYCLLLVSLPMLASFTHEGRMYTWAALATTGVFLYSLLYMKNGRIGDLIFLGLFSLMAAYTHYYCLMAAFWSNVFVLIYLLVNRKLAWRAHLLMGMAVLVCSLPWLSVLLGQVKSAHNDFWIPETTLWTVLSCYLYPFAQKIYLPVSAATYWLTAIVYGLSVMAIYNIFISGKDDRKPALGLSLFIFNATILSWVVISITFKPLLFPRYIMGVVTMIMVPPALFLSHGNMKWLKAVLSGIVLLLGVYLYITGSYFSFGPYKQSAEYLADKHPEVKKMVYFHEILPGPLMEYNKNRQLEHYWLKNENTAVYTNMDVFDGLRAFNKLDDILEKDDLFCVADFQNSPLNKVNFDLILSQSQKMNVKEVVDDKTQYGTKILLYILKYRGNIPKED
jgi:4-amino-4-deoxy-L-arabinose transferase-like glycosyltransferase